MRYRSSATVVVLLSILFLDVGALRAANVSICAVDLHGYGIADVAITVRSLALAEPQDVQKLTTNAQGWTHHFELKPGLYQIIAVTAGYKDSVKELFIDDSSTEIEIRMSPKGEIFLAPRDKESANDSWQIAVQFRFDGHRGEPVAGARVLLRDSEGHHQRWVRTDSAGRITIEILEPPLSLMSSPLVILPIRGTVHTFLLLDDCNLSPDLKADFVQLNATCVAVKDLSAEIDIPYPVAGWP